MLVVLCRALSCLSCHVSLGQPGAVRLVRHVPGKANPLEQVSLVVSFQSAAVVSMEHCRARRYLHCDANVPSLANLASRSRSTAPNEP